MIATLPAASIACQPYAPPAKARNPARSVPAAQSAQLLAALDRWAANPRHRGVEAAVILADGSRWEGTAGLAGDGEKLRSDHLITIARPQ